MDENEIRHRMAAYKNFYHVIRLTESIETPGVRAHVPSQEKVHRAIRSLDLEGKRVLDVGCRDGLYSFECEKLGAGEVIGIDNDVSPAAVEFLIPLLEFQREDARDEPSRPPAADLRDLRRRHLRGRPLPSAIPVLRAQDHPGRVEGWWSTGPGDGHLRRREPAGAAVLPRRIRKPLRPDVPDVLQLERPDGHPPQFGLPVARR